MRTRTLPGWHQLAKRKLKRLLIVVQSMGGLGPPGCWQVEIQFVSRTQMSCLNESYRGKSYPTDILSFPVLKPFWNLGFLGELVICLPTLKAQARALGHRPEVELDILLTHGVLHLLGLDHERSQKQAKVMSQWELKILSQVLSRSSSPLQKSFLKQLGLIERSRPGNDGS